MPKKHFATGEGDCLYGLLKVLSYKILISLTLYLGYRD